MQDIYIYIYIHTHTHTHAYTRHAYALTYTYMHTYMHTCTNLVEGIEKRDALNDHVVLSVDVELNLGTRV
jgi:hypothetical protein